MIDIEITVYLDLVFIINFIFDFIGLYLTGIVSDEPRRLVRFISAAIMYALVDVIVIFYNMDCNALIMLFIYTLVEMIGVSVGFGRVKLRKYIFLIVLHIGILFTMGGMVSAFKNYLRGRDRNTKVGEYVELIIIAILVLVLIKHIMPYIIKSIYYKERIYKVTLKLKGNTVKVNGLLDSGNVLREQTTGKQVTIVEKCMLKNFLDIHIDKIYIIPYKSIGKENGMLYGIQVDELIISHANFEKKIYDAVVAIYNGRLSNDNRYNAILHSECLM